MWPPLWDHICTPEIAFTLRFRGPGITLSKQPKSGLPKQFFWQTVILLGWHPPFSSFSSISGVRGAKALVFVGRMQYQNFSQFSSKPPVRGQNDRFPKRPFRQPWQNAQKCLREGAKGVFGPPKWDSPRSLLHGAKPLFGHFPPVQNTVWTVRETLLGLSAGRPQITFSTLPWALLGVSAVSTLVPGQRGRNIYTLKLFRFSFQKYANTFHCFQITNVIGPRPRVPSRYRWWLVYLPCAMARVTLTRKVP